MARVDVILRRNLGRSSEKAGVLMCRLIRSWESTLCRRSVGDGGLCSFSTLDLLWRGMFSALKVGKRSVSECVCVCVFECYGAIQISGSRLDPVSHRSAVGWRCRGSAGVC